MKYDYIIVGAGFFGAVFAYRAKLEGKKCLLIDKRNHIGGNAYTQNYKEITVHSYGPHIFHTSNKRVWDFVNSLAPFNHFVNSPLAYHKGDLYNLPFNMNTFYQLWKVITPEQARKKIAEQREPYKHITPKNLEEQALFLGGADIYEKLIKSYSEKQWGMKATEIPAFVIMRLPFRFTFDNNYFNDPFQGIPVGGYTTLFENMLENIDIQLDTDFLNDKEYYRSLGKKLVYTGQIDAYFNYCYGALEYRSLKFETKGLDHISDFQGNAIINYTDDHPYTRIVEHKHFEFGKQDYTVVTYEYPATWKKGDEPYYPINNEKNQTLFEKYRKEADKEKDTLFGGRLAEYKYYDMDKVIESALNVKF